MKNDNEFEDTDNELLSKIETAMKDHYGPAPVVSSEIDRIILADARRHFDQHGPATQRPARRRRVSTWQWAAIASTVGAACVMIFALTSQQQNQDNSVAARSETSSPDEDFSSDVDLNGRVDIQDAFAMARQIRDGSRNFRDFNHDGRFDQQDIDFVARQAVEL